MERIIYAHLYIEKYIKSEKNLLVDFIKEDEFIFFKNNGDYIEGMHLSKNYEPTMLLFHSFIPDRNIRKGDLITIQMEKLLQIRKEQFSNEYIINDKENQNIPATVFMEYNNSISFNNLLKSPDCIITHYISKKYIHRIQGFSKGEPCTLNNLGERFLLLIWNVGEGNTNSISDGSKTTLFDMGASLYYSKNQLENILIEHEDLLQNNRCISLIISHWHTDHYNLLCVVDDAFLSSLCCIFCPPDCITLTAQQLVTRIERLCKYRVTIFPKDITQSRKCGIQAVIERKKYILYTGEKSLNKNLSGLMLKIESKSALAILSADHSNYQVWDQLLLNSPNLEKKSLYIVVPHHGGNSGKGRITSVGCDKTAIISVGSNGYGHPHKKTLNNYEQADFHIIRTDQHNGDVSVKME